MNRGFFVLELNGVVGFMYRCDIIVADRMVRA